MSTATPDVLVVGSINEDIYLDVAHLPREGETVEVRRVSRATGGKGANQASAAAHAGAQVAFAGAVGQDDAGLRALADLRAVGVDVTAVQTCSSHPTGTAWVFRDGTGSNLIGVRPGANHAISMPPERLLADATAVLCQGEIHPDLLGTVAAATIRLKRRLVLNLAPVTAVDLDVIAAADPLVVNESEATTLASMLGDNRPLGLTDSVNKLAQHARSLVVTLGARGALTVVGGARAILHPASTPAAVVDTTGAGDALVGTMTSALADDADLEQAVRNGILAASRQIGVAGAFLRDPRIDVQYGSLT
jgi:ribokinase